MTQTKRALHVTYRGQTTKVGFYEGTSDAAMERAIQRALGLADEVQLRFRDADGDMVALSAALPSGVQLAAELAPTGSPASTPSADSGTGTGAVIGKPAQSGEVSDATSTLPEVPGLRGLSLGMPQRCSRERTWKTLWPRLRQSMDGLSGCDFRMGMCST